MEAPRLSNIRVFRKKIGWTQQQLAEAVDVGQSYIAKIERGLQNPSYNLVEKIFAVLREELIRLERNPLIVGNLATPVDQMVHLTPYHTFKDAKERIGDFDQLPVIDEEKCVGTITTQGIIKLVSKNQSDNIRINEIMEPPLPVFSRTTPINQMRDIMRYIDAAIIVDREKIVGIITRSDIF
jgi:predicted transcriptional regulator